MGQRWRLELVIESETSAVIDEIINLITRVLKGETYIKVSFLKRVVEHD